MATPGQIRDRQARLLEFVLRQEAEGALVTAPIDLYYLTGFKFSSGFLHFGTQSEPELIVDGRYYEAVLGRWPAKLTLGGLKEVAQGVGARRLCFDSATTTVDTLHRLHEEAKDATWLAKPNMMRHLRAVKDQYEINALRRAAELAEAGFDFVATHLKLGVQESELARELEIFWLRRGGEGLSFDPIIAFGAHSALPHHRAADRPLEEGEPVLIDIGVGCDQYQSDMTRTLFFGAVEAKLQKIYEIVREALETAMRYCRAGVQVGELDRLSREVIVKAGYGPQFTHSLGHGVGLEVHESPFLRAKPPESQAVLEANMVITLEPGIYLSGVGGVRLENTVLVTPEGCESLTKSPLNPWSRAA